MASVDAAGDPLSAATSATSLLLRTLGPAAAAASPSRALLHGPLKRSKELMEQARHVLKERGDIHKLYQDDGLAVNGQQGRRPGLDRKRARFSLKPPESNPLQNVDFSKLSSIEDPDEYFSTLDQLEEADKEMKKLRGEVPTETADHHRPMEPPKKRPGMARRKSVYSYNFSAGVDTPDVIEAPSQTETITESQSTQDDMSPSVPERTKLPVPSSSSQCDIPDVPVREDSFPEKGKGALDELLSAFKNLDEDEEENLIRKTLNIKEISIGKVSLPDLFNSPDDRPVSSTAKRKHLTSGHAPEISVSGSHLARISKWEKQILGKDTLNNKADLSEDDESDNSPGTVTGNQSSRHSPYDSVVSAGGEASTGREIPTSSTKSPDHVLEPVTNIPNGVSKDESEPRSSSFGLCVDSEVAKEKDASSGHNVSLEENDLPMDHSVIERANYEPTISSPHLLEGDTTEVLGSEQTISSPHHLEGDATEVLGSEPGRNASALHGEDDNIEHQGGVGGDGRVQGEPVHPPEIPPDTHNQSHIQDGNMEKRAVDTSNEHSLSIDGKQKAVQKGKNKKQPAKRGKRVPDKPIQTPEIPPEDIDPQNESHIHEGNIEKPAVPVSNQLKVGKQKQAQDGKRKQPLRRGKRGAEEASDPLGIPPENCDTDTQPHMQDTNIEQQTVGTRVVQSPNNGNGRKETQRRKKRQELRGRKSLAEFGFSWQSGVRRSTRIRSRPLEDWRGERFLYGRIHETMSTVIGIKAYSPSEDGKAALKVKSFVPEQYSDIVAHVAKY
ncbi:uncharacterized protein [Lolium perenne]|uniref:uncharacterized protein isoform X1 n=1 Tax=Lolium perenne TaxID=4522 RepID=UPI0021F57F5D|nr:centromere protein C isoform X1 [Lolium perenne]